MIELKYGHFAHYATSDDRGLPIRVGIFDGIRARPDGKVLLEACYLVVRLTASVADGATHTIALRFVDDDMKTVGILASSVIEFQDAGPGRGIAASVRFSIGPMGFPRAGDYTFVILADGQKVGGVPLAALEPNEPPT